MISVVHLFLYIKLPGTPRMDFHNEEFAANSANALIFLSIHTGIFLVLQLQMASVDFGWHVHPSGKKKWTNSEVMYDKVSWVLILILYLLWLLKQCSTQLQKLCLKPLWIKQRISQPLHNTYYHVYLALI